MKVNRARDLSSISVLPPPLLARRSNNQQAGVQASQLQPQQQSQQSLSQGLSSQHGMLSQFSQTSLDEVLTNEQRYSYGERENSRKSSLALVNHTREESQLPILRDSANLTRKWSAASSFNSRCQISEEIEHRMGLIQASLSRHGAILESIQGDVVQVNKRMKEVSSEVESIRQKLIDEDSSLRPLIKGQEDLKATIDTYFKSVSEQLSKVAYEDKLQELSSMLSVLPGMLEGLASKLQDQLQNTFSKEIQAARCILQNSDKKSVAPANLPSKGTSSCIVPQRIPQQLKDPASHPNVPLQTNLVLKTELGGWKSVKSGKAILAVNAPTKEQMQKDVFPTKKVAVQKRECRLASESDEEIDSGFSCLLDERETEKGGSILDEVKAETERILRKARKRKRKFPKIIVID